MTSFLLRCDDPVGVHRRVTLFAGVDDEHRANCGSLTLRESEVADLIEVLALGASYRQTGSTFDVQMP
jgi:hypothetical protein